MLDDPLERYHNRQLSWRNGVKNLVELGVGDEVLGIEARTRRTLWERDAYILNIFQGSC